MLLALLLSFAIKAENFPPVGNHQKILVFEKSEHPQNIMVLYTKLDAACHFLPDPADKTKPVFDFYWLMDRKNYKPVHPAIKQGVHGRVKVVTNGDKPEQMSSFALDLADLNELKTNLKDVRVNVIPQKIKDGCRVKAQMPLENGQLVDLTSIYTDSSRMVLPPFRHLLSAKIKGVDEKTGGTIEREFKAK